MPQCKQCGKEFNRDRDTKQFCRATCRSLWRYHNSKSSDDSVQISVQKETVSVQKEAVSVQELSKLEIPEETDIAEEELSYDDTELTTKAEEFDPEFQYGGKPHK